MKISIASTSLPTVQKADIIPYFLSRHLQTALSLTQISTIGSLVGMLLSISLNHSIVGTLPFALHVLVISETQRRQISKLQQSDRQHQLAVSQVQSGIDELQAKLTTRDNLPTISPEAAAESAHIQTHLTQVMAKLRQLQRQQQVWELQRLASLEQKFQQQQDRFEQLVAETEAVNSRSNRIEVVNQPKTVKEPMRPLTDRVTIFIDEANLYHTALARGFTIDYGKFLALLKDASPHCHAIAYVATDRTNGRQKGFLGALKRHGLELVTQEIIRRVDGSIKGNVDLRLGAELLVKRIDDYDTAVLVSGDADFVPVIEQSRSQGKRIEVVSFRSNTGAALIKAADSYLNLEQLIDRICIRN
jgi:uncharacterized LabA/DUF88 family protein